MKETEVKSEHVCTVTTSNGVEIELTAQFLEGVIKSFNVKIYDEDMSAELWLDAEGNETPDTFSELDSFPEYRDTPLEDAWQEVVDGRSDAAMKFENAIRPHTHTHTHHTTEGTRA